MARLPQNSLKPNPFTTYRDPNTGRWVVVLSNVAYLDQAAARRRAQGRTADPAPLQVSAAPFGMVQGAD